jgi:hypothetical protein
VNVRFTCPECDAPSRLVLAAPEADTPADWQCRGCDHRLRVATADASLTTCPLCGNHELYKKKDFPHGLGLTILTVACLASVFTYGWYEKWLTWAILIGSALVDGLLYLFVGDAVVCYRCGASFHGLRPTDAHKPFELTTAERYRQERLRREQLGKP